MIDNNIISYEDIKQFLIGKKEIEFINKMSEKYPVYGLFITIQKLGSPLINYSENVDFTFDDAEEFLQDYLAGTLNVKSATKILNAITSSESNFEKLIYKINENIKAIEETSLHNKVFEHQKENKEILSILDKIKSNYITPNQFFLQHRKSVYIILSTAAILLVLFLSPIQLQNELEDYYNFDETVPLDYSYSEMRDSYLLHADKIDGLQDFENNFKQGMADYLAHDYRNAIKEWDGLETKLLKLKENPEFNSEYEEDYYLYSAVSYLALSLSETEKNTDDERNILIKQSLKLFDKVLIDSDFKRYYYALSLALNRQERKALENLSVINDSSTFYPKRVVLEEQLSQ